MAVNLLSKAVIREDYPLLGGLILRNCHLTTSLSWSARRRGIISGLDTAFDAMSGTID